jgi:hypothetical protein
MLREGLAIRTGDNRAQSLGMAPEGRFNLNAWKSIAKIPASLERIPVGLGGSDLRGFIATEGGATSKVSATSNLAMIRNVL